MMGFTHISCSHPGTFGRSSSWHMYGIHNYSPFLETRHQVLIKYQFYIVYIKIILDSFKKFPLLKHWKIFMSRPRTTEHTNKALLTQGYNNYDLSFDPTQKKFLCRTHLKLIWKVIYKPNSWVIKIVCFFVPGHDIPYWIWMTKFL